MIKYSLLILTHNRLADVVRCFASLASTLERPDVRCVVLDNASGDGTREWLRDEAGLEYGIGVLSSKDNLGVAGGRARLLQCVGDCQYIVFLDSDTVILENNWLDQLGGILDARENVGMVGPGGSFVLPDWSGFTAGRPGEVDCVAGFCQCFRRDLLRLGLRLNTERYPSFWTEDSDFCLQIRDLGWDVYCVPCSVAHHPAHSGYGQDMTLHDKHIALFREQWQGKGLVKAEGAY